MHKVEKKLKTIVCGTYFGQFYLEAIKLSGEFELAGILSKGSDKSQNCAQKYGTKVYTDPNQLPSDIDLACVVVSTTVMGGEGTGLAVKLMEKGIHVVLEQPIHQKDVVLCYKTARQNNVYFVLGDLYVELPSVKNFITLAKGIINHQNPLYLNIDLATQVSFPLAHILAKVLPSLRPWKVEGTIKGNTPFQVLSMTIGGIPMVIRAHNQVDPHISDSYFHLMHSITLGVGGGSLSLVDTHGPVTWQPRLVIPDYDFIPGDITSRPTSGMHEESSMLIGPTQYPTYQEVLTRLWPETILKDIKKVAGLVRGTIPENQITLWGQQEVVCSQLWQEISNALGYPTNCENPDKEFLSVATVVGSYFQQLTMAEKYNELSKKEIDSSMEQLDKACLLAMLYQFQKNGIFLEENKCYTEEEIIFSLTIIPKHHYVMGRWLKILTAKGYLLKDGNSYRSTGITVTKDELELHWQKARDLWDHRLGSSLISLYFYQNVEALSALMAGQQKAALLLFPKGKNDVANALYRETLLAWFLNRQVAAEVEKIARKKNEKLNILEVGAGTGATSDVVNDRIRNTGLSDRFENYLYTDISAYFFSEANIRYKEAPWVSTQVLDLEIDFQEQGVEKETKDIIIANGVLNNVKDTDRVLKNLKALLVPGGVMFIIEADGESIQMLISQIFMMESADDVRKESDTTFMDEEQWLEAFAGADLKLLDMIPGNDHKLYSFGQKLFILTTYS